MALVIKLLKEGTLDLSLFTRSKLFFSDVHLNGKGRHNNSQPDLIEAILDRYPPDRWDLVFVGDTFDLWEDTWRRIQKHNRRLIMRIFEYHTIFLLGNHEPELDLILPSDVRKVWEERGFFIWHGHRLDPATSGKGAWIGRGASKVWAIIEYLGGGERLTTLKRWLLRRVQTASKTGAGNTRWKSHAHLTGAKLYVCGHTHDEELAYISPGHWFLNLGSGVRPGKISYATIVGRRITLWQMEGDGK